MNRRHALYLAPAADHPLWRAGCDWLGRDPERGEAGAAGAWRAQPRRYGFHATLKPPFALRDGVDATVLEARVSALVASRAGFEMPPLEVATLGGFLALRPVGDDASLAARRLRALADDCVRDVDDLRRPPTAAEIEARTTPDLSAAQRANVERWGYPHVFESWRFHMTLTDGLPPGEAGAPLRRELTAGAERHFAAALSVPWRCDAVALFVEDRPGADFRLVRRFAFAR